MHPRTQAFLDEMQKIAAAPLQPERLDPNRPIEQNPLLRFGARTGGTILAGVVGTGLGMLAGHGAVEALKHFTGSDLKKLPPDLQRPALNAVMQYGPGVLAGVGSMLAYESARKKQRELMEHRNARTEYNDNVRRLRERPSN
jgi:hypothetical protein